MTQIGSDKIKDIYVGSDKIKEVYYGSEKVWGEIKDGYWVHKDTGVKTYFGLEDPSIEDGIMGYPSWMPNCSEVKLPSGVTGFKTYNWVFEEFGNMEIAYTGFVYSKETFMLGNEVLIDVDLSNTSISSIDAYCFFHCFSLTSITLPEGVISLGESCFYDCYSLTSITLPESVTSIGDYCFRDCSSLILATVLPAIPPTLGYSVFDNNHSSFNIQVNPPYVDAYKTNWTDYAPIISAIGAGYWVHKDTGIKTYFDADADFITDGIMSPPSWRLNCSEAQIPSGVTGLGNYCFDYSPYLTSITLPEGITSLGNYCFRDCPSLTSITIPESVISLGLQCFRYCFSLTLATVLPAIPPSLGTNAFLNTHESLIIKVRSPYVDAYKAATNWKNYATKISAI